MTPRHRFRRWRYRRWFARHGYPVDKARLMGSICASLAVPPKVVGDDPGLNHWSAWSPGLPLHVNVPLCPSDVVLDRTDGFTPADEMPRGYEADAIWFDEVVDWLKPEADDVG